ncbi:hypothetical protein [Shewanella litorisediminis]|uniref:Uncharacterized protein n=1 Tax=Shewanella litorisediminis TaxID=1173586 RepID=A0ABX7G564_9GAMM|nr:hypothetical protein [Shewanella litorisediminis]MCL2920207.1 hypothetical protein [Shewanella litorisediminis]QRH02489.1 hypothetical protein JQC75_03425 [Shewanella litorisediminis]
MLHGLLFERDFEEQTAGLLVRPTRQKVQKNCGHGAKKAVHTPRLRRAVCAALMDTCQCIAQTMAPDLIGKVDAAIQFFLRQLFPNRYNLRLPGRGGLNTDWFPFDTSNLRCSNTDGLCQTEPWPTGLEKVCNRLFFIKYELSCPRRENKMEIG